MCRYAIHHKCSAACHGCSVIVCLAPLVRHRISNNNGCTGSFAQFCASHIPSEPAYIQCNVITNPNSALRGCPLRFGFLMQVDMRNAPHKPLASGAVTPDAALLLSSALYCTVLIITCFMVSVCTCWHHVRALQPALGNTSQPWATAAGLGPCHRTWCNPVIAFYIAGCHQRAVHSVLSL